jgi:ribulose-5-phosphate 4-epimerase/fuculose-1-phosphate aldolase
MPKLASPEKPGQQAGRIRMADDVAQALHELIVATRIMTREKVLDAFGHVSVRHPRDPQRFFIPRHRPPELAEVSDIVELTLESEPVKPIDFRLYSERVIHGEIYKARPEVNAVCHHHAHSVLPFAISGREIVPVFHLAAVIGTVPFWDQRDEFGDTNMLVQKPEEGASLARALGPSSAPACAN